MASLETKKAELHRMAMAGHTCPYGLKALDLLQRKGFMVADHKLQTREEIDALKERLHVKTTPQILIEGEQIGGYDDLVKYLGGTPKTADAVTYKPVIALFSMAGLMALATS